MNTSSGLHIVALGVNHRTAPVDVRERLAYGAGSLPAALQRCLSRREIWETSILSTCNRTELYGVGPAPDLLSKGLQCFLQEDRSLPADALAGHLVEWRDLQAAEHLFRVACGVDSMVVGETQILGQVRDGYLSAQRAGATRTLLNELFQRSLRLGKRVRSETDISRGQLSVSSVAVELARNIFGHLEDHRVLLVGAGKMGELTAKVLMKSGASEVQVISRTYERAQEVAGRCHARAAPWDELPQRLAEANIVITSTAAPGFVLDLPLMQQVVARRKGRTLFVIDIAVPRDVDPGANRLPGVFLFDIDDLQEVVEKNRAERQKEVLGVENYIASEVEAFARWWEGLDAKPVIVALRRKVKDLREQEIERWVAKMPELSEQERRLIERMMDSFANKLLHDPLVHLRRLNDGPENPATLETVRRLFNLETTEAGDRSE